MQRFSHEDYTDVSPANQRRQLFSRKGAMLVVTSLIVSLCAVLTFTPFNGIPKAHAATWNEVWGDEFNGAAGTGLNTSVWRYDTGQGIFGTGEIETMTNSTSNVYEDGNGHLVIKALRDANGNWTSGRVETQNFFGAPAGGEFAMEASFQQPNLSGAAAAGYWPAFWSLGSAVRTNGANWPSGGEIDTMEDINGLSSVFGTLHCGVNPGGPCNEPSGIGSGQRACSGCQTGLHTYRVEVDRSVSPEQIRWYLDGNNYFTVNANQVDPTTWTNAVDHSFSVIFDLAMGGGFPNAFGGGPTSATQSGGAMLIDYVRVYTSSGSTGGGGAPIGQTIWLKASNGLYASARIDQGNSPLDASASQVQAWEEYRVLDAGNGLIALQAVANGDYVSARLDQSNTPLDASVTQVQAWEEFRWLPQANGAVALQANANGDYVSARTNQTNSPLEASVTQIQAWETFQWGTV